MVRFQAGVELAPPPPPPISVVLHRQEAAVVAPLLVELFNIIPAQSVRAEVSDASSAYQTCADAVCASGRTSGNKIWGGAL